MRIRENESTQVQDNRAGRLAWGIAETIQQAILILDDHLKVVSANRFFYETFEVSALQTEGKFVYELGNRQWDIPELRRLLEMVIPTHGIFDNFMVRHSFEHIGEKVMVVSARRLEMPEDEPELILLAIDDVTESYRARRELEQSEKKYRKFVEEINSIIIAFDRNGVITFFNQFSEKLFGYSRDEVIGKKPFVGTIVPEVDSRGVDNSHLIRDMFADPKKFYQNDSEGVRKDGTAIHFSWNTKAQRDSSGEITEILIDGNDISELARIRAKLEEKSATLDTLLDFIPEGIIITDADHRVRVVSRYTEQILGIAANDLMHANEPERLRVMPMYWPGTDKAVEPDELPLSKSILNGQTYEDFEVELRYGSVKKAFSVNSAPIFDKRGHIVGAIGGWREVTDRRSYLLEIERRKRVLDAIMDYAPVGIMLADGDGIITDVSRVQCEYFAKPADEIIGKEERPDRWGILNSSTRKPLLSHCMPLCRAIRKGETIAEEEYIFFGAGGEHTFGVSAAPIYNRKRSIIGAITVWRNVDERKKYERRLQQNSLRLRSMFDLHKAIMLLIDPDTGAIVDANHSAVNFYGFSHDTLCGMHINDLNRLPSRRIKQEMQMALDQRRDYFVFPHRLSNGTTRWVEVYSSPVQTDRKSLLYSIIHDITERKEAQDALRASEERFRGIFDHAALGILEADRDGHFIAANAAICRMLGYSTEQLLNMSVHQLTAPEDRQLSDSQHRRVHRGESNKFTYEKRYLKHDNTPLWVNVSVSVLHDSENRHVGSVATVEDITQRREAQKELRISAERFRRIVSSEIIGVTIADFQGGLSFANDYFLNMLGYGREELERHAIDWKEITPPEYRKRDYEALVQLAAAGAAKPYQKEFLRKDGSRVWVLLADTMLPGTERHILAFVLDVTPQRRALDEAQKRRAEVEAILGSLPDGYIIYDQDGKIVQMNERAAQIIGFTDEDKILSFEERMRNLRVIAPNGEPFPLSRIPSWKALHGETTRDAVMRIDRSDRHFWISVSASPIIADDRVLGAIMEFSDITRLHTLQEQLTNERNFINAILQTSGAPIMVTDDSGDIVRLNSACEQLSGYSEAELMSRSFYDLLIPHEERAAIKEAFDSLRDGERVVEHENHWVTKSGDKKFIRWRNTLLRDDQTEKMYIVATGIDISDRRHLEQELNRRAEELFEANRELESFSYSVSHDLRSPLHTIASFAAILKDDYTGCLDEEGREYLRYIDEGIKKMDRLISDLLALSRINRQEIVRKDVDLSALVSDFLGELQQTSPGRKAEFVTQPHVHASGDERLVDVALKNLLRNAWKFTGKNELTRIEFGTLERNAKTVYYVRDNGVGFDNKFAKKIFEPFKRTHAQKDFGGTGVGLSIVQRVVSRHGGEIWAEGEVGVGAGFYFTLG